MWLCELSPRSRPSHGLWTPHHARARARHAARRVHHTCHSTLGVSARQRPERPRTEAAAARVTARPAPPTAPRSEALFPEPTSSHVHATPAEPWKTLCPAAAATCESSATTGWNPGCETSPTRAPRVTRVWSKSCGWPPRSCCVLRRTTPSPRQTKTWLHGSSSSGRRDSSRLSRYRNGPRYLQPWITNSMNAPPKKLSTCLSLQRRSLNDIINSNLAPPGGEQTEIPRFFGGVRA